MTPPLFSLQLDDLVVWITGASGGIGWACAEAFASAGARLVLSAGRNVETLRDQVAAAGLEQHALVTGLDLRDPDDCERVAAAAVQRFGRVDLCVPNAGIWPEASLPLWELPTQRVRDVIDVNLLGVMWTLRAFCRVLANQPEDPRGRAPSVTMIGSTAGRFGEAGHAEYSTTKAALHGLLRSLKNELVALHPFARVNLVEPGWTVTPMAEAALEDDDTIRAVIRTMPLQQLARAQDIAMAVLSLSSPVLSRHVTGEVITVAGGMEGRVQWMPDQVNVPRVRARLAASRPDEA